MPILYISFYVFFLTSLLGLHAQSDDWQCVWHDEFEGNQLDTTKWSRCQKGANDWNNTMSQAPSLLKIKDGVLSLMGLWDKKNGFRTAGITSRHKYSFCYGKILIRAKMDHAQGGWPALWMLGINGPWPANGEIDILEHLNDQTVIHQTVHSLFTHSQKDNKPSHKTSQVNTSVWNTYGVTWDADSIRFSINGKETFCYKREEGLKDQYPFTQPFYILMTMQIGGSWVGPPHPSDYPAALSIDWVRVYKKTRTSL